MPKHETTSKRNTSILFKRYIWLIDTIAGAGKISLEEINERWCRSSLAKDINEGLSIPRRTFRNHCIAIEDLFDININCDRKDKFLYYIENSEDLYYNNTRNWLLNTFAISNLISESRDIKDRILFENIPSGHKYLSDIIKAMKNSNVIKITYQSFFKNTPEEYTIEPYCVKIFRQRWYIVANKVQNNSKRIFALDRIYNMETLKNTFTYPYDFDPATYFNDYFGIIVDNRYKAETIKIKIYGNQCKYIRALPLHKSQKEIINTAEYSIFRYRLRPTVDFVQEILSFGSYAEVIAPDGLCDEMSKIINKMSGYYNK